MAEDPHECRRTKRCFSQVERRERGNLLHIDHHPPIPNTIGSDGIKVGARVPYFGRFVCHTLCETPLLYRMAKGFSRHMTWHIFGAPFCTYGGGSEGRRGKLKPETKMMASGSDIGRGNGLPRSLFLAKQIVHDIFSGP